MKVLCINSSSPKTPLLLRPGHYIHEGETYTVRDRYFDKTDGHEYYYLEERQMTPLASYRACRFLPLFGSGEDEDYNYLDTNSADKRADDIKFLIRLVKRGRTTSMAEGNRLFLIIDTYPVEIWYLCEVYSSPLYTHIETMIETAVASIDLSLN